MDEPVTVSRRRCVMALTVLAFAIVFANVVVQMFAGPGGPAVSRGVVHWLWLDAEENLPAFFSAVLFLIATGLLALIAIAERRRHSRWARHWLALTVLFAGLSFDEGSQIHELMMGPAEQWLGAERSTYLRFAWVVPGSALVALVGIWFVRFLWLLERSTRGRLCVAAVLFLGGSLVLEAIGGHLFETDGPQSLAYRTEVLFEESAEMAGLIVFIDALFGALIVRQRDIAVRIAD